MYLLNIHGIIGEEFKYSDVLLHLNSAKNEQIIKLVINSPGGDVDEGEKIREALRKSGKVLYSTNSGDVASYAVSLFLLAPKENRSFNPERGKFVIHLPFTPPNSVGGTADELEYIASELKKIQGRIIKQYSESTGADINVLEGFMREDIPLTTEQITLLGFANIETSELKAVAYYKFKNDKMDNEVKEKLTGIEGLLNKIVNLFKPKNLIIQDVNGSEIDFGESIQDESQIVVGTKAVVDGSPAEGEYTLPSGNILVFVGGELTEIKPATNELKTLKSENDLLKRELETLKSEKQTLDTEFSTFKTKAEMQIYEIRNEVVKFKNQFSDGDEGGNNSINTGKGKYLTKAELEKQLN